MSVSILEILVFFVTKNRNTRIPRYGQVCHGTYHAKEVPRYTGVLVFFPNPSDQIYVIWMPSVFAFNLQFFLFVYLLFRFYSLLKNFKKMMDIIRFYR